MFALKYLSRNFVQRKLFQPTTAVNYKFWTIGTMKVIWLKQIALRGKLNKNKLFIEKLYFFILMFIYLIYVCINFQESTKSDQFVRGAIHNHFLNRKDKIRESTLGDTLQWKAANTPKLLEAGFLVCDETHGLRQSHSNRFYYQAHS